MHTRYAAEQVTQATGKHARGKAGRWLAGGHTLLWCIQSFPSAIARCANLCSPDESLLPCLPFPTPCRGTPPAVLPGATVLARVPMTHAPHMQAPEQGAVLQVAIKCNQLGVLYLNDSIPQHLMPQQAPAQQQPLSFF